MDLRFTDEELAFRDEVRDFFRTALPDSIRRKMIAGAPPDARTTSSTWTPHPQRQGLGRAALAGGMGRHRLEPGAAVHLPGRAAAGAGARAAGLQRQHGRPGVYRLRHRGAEAALPAAHRQSRRLVVPGLLRARRRLRPRVAQDDARSATATTTSSTARRPGPRSRSTPTGSSAWCAPTRRRRSRRASPSC